MFIQAKAKWPVMYAIEGGGGCYFTLACETVFGQAIVGDKTDRLLIKQRMSQVYFTLF